MDFEIERCKVANRNNFANFLFSPRCSPRCTSLRPSRSRRILPLFLSSSSSSSSSFFSPPPSSLSHNGIAKNSILPETVKNNAPLAFFCLFSDCSRSRRGKQGQVKGGKIIRNGLLESDAEREHGRGAKVARFFFPRVRENSLQKQLVPR